MRKRETETFSENVKSRKQISHFFWIDISQHSSNDISCYTEGIEKAMVGMVTEPGLLFPTVSSLNAKITLLAKAPYLTELFK